MEGKSRHKKTPSQIDIPLKDPLSDVFLINGMHGAYANMMRQHYFASREASALRQRDDISVHERHEAARRAREEGILVIVLAGMALESAVNAMGVHYFHGNRFETATRHLTVRDKWQVLMRLAFGRPFREKGPVYQAMRELNQNRNALVHNRSKQLTSFYIGEIEQAMKDSHPDKRNLEAKQAFETVIKVSYAAHSMTPDPACKPVLLQSYDLERVPYLEEEFPADIWAEIVAVRESMSDAEY